MGFKDRRGLLKVRWGFGVRIGVFKVDVVLR